MFVDEADAFLRKRSEVSRASSRRSPGGGGGGGMHLATLVHSSHVICIVGVQGGNMLSGGQDVVKGGRDFIKGGGGGGRPPSPPLK